MRHCLVDIYQDCLNYTSGPVGALRGHLVYYIDAGSISTEYVSSCLFQVKYLNNHGGYFKNL